MQVSAAQTSSSQAYVRQLEMTGSRPLHEPPGFSPAWFFAPFQRENRLKLRGKQFCKDTCELAERASVPSPIAGTHVGEIQINSF